MPVVLFATIASAVAAAGMYVRKKQAKQHMEDERLIERLDSIALRDAIVAPDQRLFAVSDKVDGPHRPG